MATPWFETVAVAQRRARARLPRSVYGALVAGTEAGLTVRDNVAAFSELGFAPRVAGHVEFSHYGCLGCSGTPAPAAPSQPVHCDAPPDEVAPSLSFLSAFPGLLAAGECIKEAGPSGGLRGRFDHVFRYGLNPDLVSTPGFRPDCTVGCQRPSKIAQYSRKYLPEC